jgi:hypothetical protein
VKYFLVGWMALALIAMAFISCLNPTSGSGTPGGPETPEPPPLLDPAFWFGDVHAPLIKRLGVVSSEGYTDEIGEEMGQAANCQYVCNAINAKRGTSYVPVAGTALLAANCEYLLKLIDKANRNTTTYGTGIYATKQIVDTIAVNDAVSRLWVPGGKFVAITVSNGNAAYSTDGINWSAATLPSSAYWGSVTYGGQ